MKNLNNVIGGYKGQVTRINNKLQSKIQEFESYKRKVRKVVANAKSKIASLELEVEKANKKSDGQIIIDYLKGQINDLNDKLAKVQPKVEVDTKKFEDEINSLKAQVKDLESFSDDLIEENESKDQRIKELEAQLEAAQQSKEITKDELMALVKDNYERLNLKTEIVSRKFFDQMVNSMKSDLGKVKNLKSKDQYGNY